MKKNGTIEFISNTDIKVVDLQERKIEYKQKGNEESLYLKFDAMIANWHIRAPEVLKKSGLLDDSGFISVDSRTLQSKFDGLYVLGDCSSIVNPSNQEIHPKSSFFHVSQAQG